MKGLLISLLMHAMQLVTNCVGILSSVHISLCSLLASKAEQVKVTGRYVNAYVMPQGVSYMSG